MATDTVFPPTDSMGAASEIAGNDAVSDTSAQDSSNTSSNMNDQPSAGSAPEDTLESHEVIELHAFIERKVWIDEKIQFLEKLPPIEVFAGTDGLQKPMDQITGLTTRAQLEEWILEHDRIEKETEIFDSGDLKKLKKFTKACTQRNLSPEDTDLIELTLTTLYALDKLLHLLRDRSENLDLLGHRLAWEEQRAQAFATRQSIVDDLHIFLMNRARWSPAVYTSATAINIINSDSLKPRSLSITTPPPSESPDLFSRGLRFKLHEDLSRDAAQLSSRVTTLRHGHVATTGRLLDKLIDDSRKPVPDAMLDEQDRLEEKCANELDSVGKFLMATVTQWKKADEIYNETKKDINALRRLQEELNLASSRQPSRRMESTFSSRVDVIAKRIAARTNPISPRGTFPMPSHALFPDQSEFNAGLVRTLSAELTEASSSLEQVNNGIDVYRSGCDAMERVDKMSEEISESLKQISGLKDRIQHGIQYSDGDGSPPDLSLIDCVDPLRFSNYLAVLPNLSEEVAKAESSATTVLDESKLALIQLDKLGLEVGSRDDFSAEMGRLQTALSEFTSTWESTLANVTKLRDIRRIWSTVSELIKQIDALSSQTYDALERERWKQQFTREELPPSPEGSQIELSIRSQDFVDSTTSAEKLSSIYEVYTVECEGPFNQLSASIPAVLVQHVQAKLDDFQKAHLDLKGLCITLVEVERQATTMSTLRDEAQRLETKLEDLLLTSEELTKDILQSSATETKTAEGQFAKSCSAMEKEIETWINTLSGRVVYISTKQKGRSSEASTTDHTRAQVNNSRSPFNCSVQNRVVRHDVNTFAMSLSGGVRKLHQKLQYVRACTVARSLDDSTGNIEKDITLANEGITGCRQRLLALSSRGAPDVTQLQLQEVRREFEVVKCVYARIEDTLKLSRLTLSRLRDGNGLSDTGDHDHQMLIKSRTSSLERVEELCKQVAQAIDSVHAQIVSTETELEKAKEIQEVEDTKPPSKIDDDNASDSDLGVGDDTLVQDSIIVQEAYIDGSNILAELDKDLNNDQGHTQNGSSPIASSSSEELNVEVMLRVKMIMQKLHSLALGTICSPSPYTRSGPSSLPTVTTFERLGGTLIGIKDEAKSLPSTSTSQAVIQELARLRQAITSASIQLKRIEQLARVSTLVGTCDDAFSDLLNHIDSYPSLPDNSGSSSNLAPPESPEELLSIRVTSTKNAVSELSELFAVVADDPRAQAEHSRIIQTWEELMDMAMDRISGRSVSRQASTSGQSSGRNSSASTKSAQVANPKRGLYNTLSQGSKALQPPAMQRRAVSNSGSTRQQKQQPQRPVQNQATRTVSGPVPRDANSSLYKSTFASRQRTMSTVSNSSTPPSRPSSVMGKERRTSALPNTVSRSSLSSVKSSSPKGTWARAPRQSFSSIERPQTPQNKPVSVRRKQYIPNPSNKLDVAVGDVVNKLPVDIEIEVVADTWKDQSGKYWIGGEDPKLCFCRILRSQTVMVRVGGGWTELSKFIKDHFADLFRLIPESPPRPGSKDEKWINASSLREAAENGRFSSLSPKTPEPIASILPSFALSSPDGAKAQSIRTDSPFGSPLTPLQFIRRAGNDPSEVSVSSISRASSVRPPRRSSLGMSSNPPKFAAWRP